MILLGTGIAYTLVPNQVYALPAKAVLLSSAGTIEQSWDGINFSPVVLTNGSASLASMFIRSIAEPIVSLKEYSATVNSPGGGNQTPSNGDLIINDTSPTLTIINSSGGANVRRWQITVDPGGDLKIDSQSDAGVSYNRPVMISVYNGGITTIGPINVSSPSGFSGTFLNLPEIPFANIPTAQIALGTILNISDSTVNTIGSVITGGGANHVLGRYNGTAWKVIGL